MSWERIPIPSIAPQSIAGFFWENTAPVKQLPYTVDSRLAYQIFSLSYHFYLSFSLTLRHDMKELCRFIMQT